MHFHFTKLIYLCTKKNLIIDPQKLSHHRFSVSVVSWNKLFFILAFQQKKQCDRSVIRKYKNLVFTPDAIPKLWPESEPFCTGDPFNQFFIFSKVETLTSFYFSPTKFMVMTANRTYWTITAQKHTIFQTHQIKNNTSILKFDWWWENSVKLKKTDLV